MMPLGGHWFIGLIPLGSSFGEMPLSNLLGKSGSGGAVGGALDKIGSSDVPRILPRQIGMPSLPFGIIPGTKPEPLKIAKTGQRARSWRAHPLERLDVEAATFRLQRLGSNTETGEPYTEEEIAAIVRNGKQRGHLPGVDNKSPNHTSKMMMRLFRSDNKFSQMLDQFESSPEFGGPNGGGGCGDDEPGGDEDGDEDEEDEEDGDS
ncbi:hypothetical protein Tco_0958376 [Tanacetum coccineum]